MKPTPEDDGLSDVAEMAKVTAEMKAEWMDHWMQRLLPPDIYALAQSKRLKDRRRLSKAIVDLGLSYRETGDHTAICQGPVTLGQFKIIVGMDKVESQYEDFTVDFAANLTVKSKICKACGCRIDSDGCGCNPHDA